MSKKYITNEMIMDLIDYVRGWFSAKPKRKRSSAEDFDIPVSAKIRKICLSPITSTPEEDWYKSTGIHRPKGVMEPEDTILRPSWLIKPTIVIDDDTVVNGAKKKQTFNTTNAINLTSSPGLTSTPNLSRCKNNGFEDLTFRKYTENTVKKSGIKKKFDHPQSSYFSTVSNFSQNTSQNRSNFIKSLKKNSFLPSLSRKCGVGFNSNAVDISFRLEEKRKYRELLNKPQNLSKLDIDSFAKYSTPIGRFSPKLSRNHKLIDLTQRKPIETLDLTNGDYKSPNTSKLSTKDKINKLLDKIDNDRVIELKDSDSDVDILPRPPSPKPDIKVDRINSLKTNVHESETHHDDWITNTVKKHKEDIAKREKDLALAKAHYTNIKDIVEDVRSKQLEDQIKNCLHIRETVLPVVKEDHLPELNREQEELVARAFSRRSLSEVLVKKFNLNISRRDIMTLAGLNWLNDEIINFYMSLIIERGKDGRKFPKAFAFNTFFYQKLLRDGPHGLRRWTKNIDIFSYDLVAVPIHMSMHWCMAIIDFRKKHIGYYDSMGGQNNKCLSELLKYLLEEHAFRKEFEYDVSDWSKECFKDIPQQMNGSDCGVFACTFAEFLARNGSINFSQEDMPYLRKKMVVEILEGRLLIN